MTVYSKGIEEKIPSLKESYYKVGFRTVKEAKNDFQKVYGDPYISDIIVKKFLFKPTQSFGRFSISEKSLELDYINDSTHELFKINVSPVKNAIPLSSLEKVGTMEDGTQFSYMKRNKFDIFRFKTGRFAYMLSSNYKGENSHISKNDFISVAQLIIKGTNN
jgi:hypothetical protein